MQTTFEEVYSVFLNKVTDDMYLEYTEADTMKLLKPLLIAAVPLFEFPRMKLTYDENNEVFDEELNAEEINIIATYMVINWLGQQLASVENTRMKYSGSDFKFTSQAAHLKALQALTEFWQAEGKHLQRLYTRRKPDQKGIFRSTFSTIMEKEE